MTELELAGWLRSMVREQSPEEVEESVHRADVEQGEYVPHEGHPNSGESRH